MLIKICGLTQLQDVLFCDRTGVNFLGFIFYKKSPRNVPQSLLDCLPQTRGKKVGVFVHQKSREIIDILEEYNLDMAQLHGPYTPQDCQGIGPQRVIKVIWPEQYQTQKGLCSDLEKFTPYCRYFLLDGGPSGGGHGKAIASPLLKGLSLPRPWFLAGGLGPENVLESWNHCHPQGIDLNSGVETAPGLKDHKKISQVIELCQKKQFSNLEHGEEDERIF